MKKFFSIITLLILSVSLFAVPANRRPFVVKQPDGTMLSVVMRGDEALHFYTTLDGKYLVKGDAGEFCYATFSEGVFVSTGVVAHNKDERGDAENELLSNIDFQSIDEAVNESHMQRSAQYRSSVATRSVQATRTVTKGEVFIPVLLVEYQDVKFSFKKKDVEKLLNEPGYSYSFDIGKVKGYGSARDYFIAQSGGLFSPRFVVSDIITVPNNMAYYGGNNSSGNDKNPQGMIRDAIGIADSAMDFSKFDNDKDGEVEFLYCIYAGYSEANGASKNTIWPHQWTLTSNGSKKKVDGVYCNVYACSSELNVTEAYEVEYGKWLAGIGTICHEFSHCLGLHDVYDVAGSGNWGMDEWDLMAIGNHVAYGYIPVGYNSFQKDVCGWQQLQVLDARGRYSMEAQSRGGVGYKIVNDANPNEYFILESRKSEGWDQSFRASGMMIIHVDYDKNAWSNNKINTISGHPRFQIVPADNELMVYSDNNKDAFYESLAADLWPGKKNNNEFTDTSIPAAKVYTGGYLGKPVTNIKYENDVVSFNFMGGKVDAPAVQPATDVASGSFVANWDAVKYASEYIVELYMLEETETGVGDVEALVAEDFLNCNKSATPIQNEMDTYMSVNGWSGSNVYSETGMLCIGSLSNSGSIVTPMLDTTGDVAVSVKASKYNSNATDIKLHVEVLDASDNVVASMEIVSAGIFVLDAVVDGNFRVRFATDAGHSNKRVLVDDISVVVTLPYKKVLVDQVRTVACSYLFSNLENGDYAYRVKATDGDAESEFSEYVNVALLPTSVLDIATDSASVTVYTITGLKVYEGDASDVANLPRGIYVVKDSAGIKKIKIE